jgi:hypothetical protein
LVSGDTIVYQWHPHSRAKVPTEPLNKEPVKQGQLVATIQDDDYRAKVVSSEAAVEDAPFAGEPPAVA